MASETLPRRPQPHRPSRFIEGEPLTRTPSARRQTSPLLSSILSEQDQHPSQLPVQARRTWPTTSMPTSLRTKPISPITKPVPLAPREFSWEQPSGPRGGGPPRNPTATSPVSHPLFRRFDMPAFLPRAGHGQAERLRGRRSLEERRRRGRGWDGMSENHRENPRERAGKSENIVGRIRALTMGQSALERKIMMGEVVLYPGT